MNSELLPFEKVTIMKILRAKKRLESKLNVKLKAGKETIEIKGEEIDIYTTKKVLDAIDRTFPVSIALLLAEPDFVMEDVPIKNFTPKKNLFVIRARIIGKEGRTLELLSELSSCYIVLHKNIVSVIGTFEKIKDTMNSIRSLIQGSKQANVYSYLEKARTKYKPENLALKKE